MAGSLQSRSLGPLRDRFAVVLDWYVVGLAAFMMLLGLYQWAIIIGLIPGPHGVTFEAQPTAWKMAIMYLAVADPVAAVGLWMRVAWGRVMWVVAAVSEIALHTVFVATYGADIVVVVVHAATLLAFAVLAVLSGRRLVEQGLS
jgi:hypothetical protein